MSDEIQRVLAFWFEDLQPADWFKKSAELDRRIAEDFAECHCAAAAGELFLWRQTAVGRLAEVIVLDQFSRNIYRDRAAAFTWDGMALVLAQQAVACGADQQLSEAQRAFLYMPFMHSESRLIQRESLRLFGELGREDNLRFARRHAEIIEQFGRYPHRNALLGRESSEAERAFLREPGSAF